MNQANRKHRANSFLFLTAIVLAAGIYFVFMSETAVAPPPKATFATVTPQEAGLAFQKEDAAEYEAHVLMYHHVGDLPQGADDIRKGLTVSGSEFEAQVKYLAENNYVFLTLDELKEQIQTNKVVSRAVVLTFDDGYSDNHSVALPILEKYSAKGTFFIITSKIGSSEYMTKDQVLDLQKTGNEIGSHTVDHNDLSSLKGERLKKQLTESKSALEELTGKPVVSLCYPSGRFNDEAVNAVRDAGYKIAVTTQASKGKVVKSNLFEVARYRISANMSFPALFR